MKKKVCKFLLGLFVVSIMIATGCKKDSDDGDDADKFVGTYRYTMTVDSQSQTGDLIVKKTASNKITMTQMTVGSIPTPYTVSGNNITEDSGQTGEMNVEGGGTATFTENSTGSISGNTITINGSWTNSKYVPIFFKVVAVKK